MKITKICKLNHIINIIDQKKNTKNVLYMRAKINRKTINLYFQALLLKIQFKIKCACQFVMRLFRQYTFLSSIDR